MLRMPGKRAPRPFGPHDDAQLIYDHVTAFIPEAGVALRADESCSIRARSPSIRDHKNRFAAFLSG